MSDGAVAFAAEGLPDPVRSLRQLVNSLAPDGAPWRVAANLPGGSQGAYLLRDARHRPWVAKWYPGAHRSDLQVGHDRVERVRAAGTPAPRYRLLSSDDGTLVLQTFVQGHANPALNVELATDLLRINSGHSGLADTSPDAWRALMSQALTEGLDGYASHASLREHSTQTRQLLDRILSVGGDPAVVKLPAMDLVHYDFHLGNVLTADGQVASGIVDWEAIRTGDRGCDLAALAFTTMWRNHEPAALNLVWSEFWRVGTLDSQSVYLHYTVLVLVDWILRHNPELTSTVIECAQRALASLDART